MNGMLFSVEKVLDSLGSSGQALIPQKLDPYIAEMALKLSPMRALLPRRPWTSGTFDKNKRTALGAAGFVPDNATRGETGSTYTRFQEPLKILQSRGGVTGFEQFASQEHVDAFKNEVNGNMQAALYEEEFGMLYGNRSADSYMFNGLDTWLDTNRSIVASGPTDKVLDDLIDPIVDSSGKPGMIAMSVKMLSKFSRILKANHMELGVMETEAGLRFRTYRNIPIVESSFIKGNQEWPGGSVTAAQSAGTGLDASTTYYYKVSAVMQTGETLPCTEVSAATDGSSNKRITLQWTAPTGEIRLYKIFRSTTSGEEKLYTVIPGKVYSVASDILGTLSEAKTTTWIDTGVTNSQATTYGSSLVTGAAYTPGTNQALETPLAANEEDIFVVSTYVPGITEVGSTRQATSNATEMIVGKELGMIPIAKIADRDLFMLVQYSTMVCLEQYCSKARKVQLAA